MSGDVIKRYTNGEVTVIWQPSLCVHSTICFRGLPAVFDPRRVRGWSSTATPATPSSGRGMPLGRPVVRARARRRVHAAGPTRSGGQRRASRCDRIALDPAERAADELAGFFTLKDGHPSTSAPEHPST